MSEPAEVTAGNILDQIRECSRILSALPPPPARLECADDVREYLAATLPTRRHGAVTSPWSVDTALGLLTGVPIVVRDDMTRGAWRLLDTDGQVIHEGVIDSGSEA